MTLDSFRGQKTKKLVKGDSPGTNDWLVVSTHLKNISQNGNLPQIGVKIKDI